MIKKRSTNLRKYLYMAIIAEISSLIILVLLSAYFLRMQRLSQDSYKNAVQLRYDSFLLADQLRHSSDDLTRMVRSYVATGDTRFEDYFWDILAIREGKKARPINYERVYWDFMTIKNPVKPFSNGLKVPLETLMNQAGFTKKEFQLLADAKAKSDKLIALERVAMHAMKGEFQDGKGEFTVRGEPDPEMAMRIVFGEAYHDAKRSIMKPINDFFKTIDQRTLKNVASAISKVNFNQKAMVILFCLLIINGFLLFLTLKTHQKIEIRERKTSEDKLKEAQKISQLGNWELDLKTNELFWSDEIYRIFEIDQSDFGASYEAFLAAVHPEDRDFVNLKYTASVEEKKPYMIDHRLLLKDGRVKYVHEQGETFYDGQGNGLRTVGIVQDITVQKQMKEALKTTQMHYTEFINASSDPVSYLKVPPGLQTNLPAEKQIQMLYHSVFVDANKANWQSFGLQHKEELIGKTYIELIKDQAFDQAFSDFINNGYRLEDYEITHKSSAGKIYYGLENWFGVVESDTLTHIWTISKNITERKKAEKEKMTLERQLRRAQKMEAIGSLSSGIAHDFNNILLPIIGYAEMLAEDIPDESPLQEMVMNIYDGGKRARELVKQLLTLSRETEQEIKPVKFQMVVNEICKLIKSFIPSTIEITQNINKNCGFILADPTQLHQITMNLVTNAFHAMEDSGGKLEITLDEVELSDEDLRGANINPGKYVCLRVCDTGKGIHPKDVERIFDPYFTTKMPGKGTGLGLSIVHSLVRSYKGEIIVYSEPGKGTVFRVFLPLLESVESPDITIESIENLKGNERILVVDDDPKVLTFDKKMLERLGYKVTTINNSQNALETFRKSPYQFDVVITDMTMPKLTGDLLAQRLMEVRPDIPVILCTGFSEKMSEEKAKKVGLKGFIMKPIIRREIAKAIRRALDDTEKTCHNQESRLNH